MAAAPPDVVRIVRIIEYLIKPGQDAGAVLRNSLVGTMTFAWGQLTGTIVDSVDMNQEDRLRLAKLQPGVWLANPEAMAAQGVHTERLVRPLIPPRRPDWQVDPRNRIEEESRVEPPDTGPSYTRFDAQIGAALVEMGGYKLAYTLALGLQAIAEELNQNAEPDKFLTSDEALALANALMAQIPADWTGIPAPAPTETVTPVERDPADAERRAAIRERMADAAKPTPVFREVEPDARD